MLDHVPDHVLNYIIIGLVTTALHYYSCKMIPAKTQYKTHEGELLAIVEVFKTW